MLLIAANAWFVAAEFAYVVARPSRLAAVEGRSGRRAVALHRRLSFMLSGAQLGITVTSLLVGYIAEPTLGAVIEPLLGAIGFPDASRTGTALAIAFVVATVSQMVFGELVPKNLAIARPEQTATRIATPTTVFLTVAGPIIRFFDGSANRLLRRLGIEPVDALRRTVSPEELAVIVGASQEAGALTAAQAELLDRALGFRDLDAAAVMVPWNRVVTLPESATGADLRRALHTSTHMRFPIVDERGEPVAVVHAKDLLRLPGRARDEAPIRSLAHDVPEVPETRPLPGLLTELRTSGSPLAIVVGEHGEAAGIVTVEDLVEELVGEIEDEHDRQAATIRALDDRRWLVPGLTRPDELERATGLALPEGPYETVAGFVMSRLGRIPRVGDRVSATGLVVEVVRTEGRTVGSAIVSTALTSPDARREAAP